MGLMDLNIETFTNPSSRTKTTLLKVFIVVAGLTLTGLDKLLGISSLIITKIPANFPVTIGQIIGGMLLVIAYWIRRD